MFTTSPTFVVRFKLFGVRLFKILSAKCGEKLCLSNVLFFYLFAIYFLLKKIFKELCVSHVIIC